MGALPSSLQSPEASLWPLLIGILQQLGLSWQQMLLAWARILPLVVMVPAFGSRLMPAPARAVFGLALAALLLPTVVARTDTATDFGVAFLGELLRGLPVALSSGALIWGAMMAGGLVDDLRGASQQQSQLFQEARSPLGALIGLFAVGGFLELGGVESALSALVVEPTGAPLAVAVRDLVSSLNIAFALCAPLLCVAVVWEVAGALIARAATPAHVQSLLAPLRAMVILGAFTVTLPTFFELLVGVFASRLSPP